MPLPEKAEAMQNYEKPKSAKGLCRYLGMVNFHRRFVHNSAHTLMLPYDLLTEHNELPENAPLNWTKELEAFNKF